MVHGREKSDSVIVAVKPTNKTESSAAELVEPRTETKGNVVWQSTRRTQSRISVSQAVDRIRQISAVKTRGRSRMRESRTYGSVRGALSNERPYRDRQPKSWCDPAGASPAQVRSSVHLVASVAWPLATVVAKRTQRLHGVWD